MKREAKQVNAAAVNCVYLRDPFVSEFLNCAIQSISIFCNLHSFDFHFAKLLSERSTSAPYVRTPTRNVNI